MSDDGHDRLQRVLDSLFVFVGLITPDGVLVEANRAPLDAARLTRDDVVGRPFAETYWFSHSPELQAQVRDLLRRAAQGETIRQDIDARIADGRLIIVDAIFSPIEDDRGRVVEVVASGVDVTDRKRSEIALRQSEELLRQAQKMEAVGRLAGGVAHDFNNLLTAIVGYSELALARLPRTHPVRGDVEEIRHAAESAVSLTRQLLTFGRRQTLELQRVDLNAIVHRVQALLRRTIGEDVGVVTRLAPALEPVDADPGQMEQVLMNLAVNARDAMPHGGTLTFETTNVDLDEAFIRQCVGAGATVGASVGAGAGAGAGSAGGAPGGDAVGTAVVAGRYVRVAVTDTGIGMDDTVRSHLFEPFFTTKAVGKGTGLGLATVYGIVSQSGGFVCVETAPGRGSTFEVFLPPARPSPRG